MVKTQKWGGNPHWSENWSCKNEIWCVDNHNDTCHIMCKMIFRFEIIIQLSSKKCYHYTNIVNYRIDF